VSIWLENGMAFAIALIASGVALIGCLFGLASAILVLRFGKRTRAVSQAPGAVAVTILKPLHGSEPRLMDNLASFLTQNWRAPIQLIAGVHSATDPARKVAETLKIDPSNRSSCVIVDPRRHGANAKISNIMNMMAFVDHDIIVLSDSDIAVERDYLTRVIASLNEPGVGAVTCVYRGRGDAGFWSVLGAAGISYQFLPNVLTGISMNAGDVCMGSTIALRRDTLEQLGGFGRFANILADDHAIGVAVRGLGLKVAVAPIIVTHASIDATFTELFRHELRWAATVRNLKPGGYFGTILTNPLPFAVIALLLLPGPAMMGVFALSLLSRVLIKKAVDQVVGTKTAPLWILPLRDILSFGVFLSSYFVRSVDWRGERLDVTNDGRISASGGNQ